jgi:hypothetical protein
MLAGKKTIFLHVTVNTFDKNLQENSFFAVSFLQILPWEKTLDFLAGPWRTAVLMCMLAGKKNLFSYKFQSHI